MANDEPLELVRRRFAEELAASAGVTDQAIVDGFAAVPRERFVPPGPWKLIGPALDDEVTPDADPRRLYQNARVAPGAGGEVGSGDPWFWAWALQRLAPRRGERIVDLGIGGGYYTAILSEIAREGEVLGVELDAARAASAVAALAAWPRVRVLTGDAHRQDLGRFDALIATFGLDTVPLDWVRGLNDGGRLFFPLTMFAGYEDAGGGAMLLVTRRGEAFDARLVGSLMISHDETGRTDRATRRLGDAYPPVKPGEVWQPPKIASLRLDKRPDRSCWLKGQGWWLSTAPNP